MSRKHKFLLIDDQIENLITIKALVKEAFAGAEIFTAQSGETGIKEAQANEPDVILLDILMPGMDGYEVCRRLKADLILRDIPILFVTALKSEKENRLKALESGGEAFINKPIDDIELFVQLRGMLKIREKNIADRNEQERLNQLVLEKTGELLTLKEKYAGILNDLPALVCEFNPDSTLTYVNKTYCDYFKTNQDELIGKPFLDFLPEQSREKAKRKYLSLRPHNPINHYSHQTEVNGEMRWQEWRDRAIFDKNNQLVNFYSIGVDITEKKLAEEKLLFLSYHDHMTGLYNRRFFEEEVKRLDKARNLPLTIIMADVNGLKLVNDSFGHDAGDQLLQEAAKAIQQGCRLDDVVARVGGDEFAILLPNTDSKTATDVIKRIKGYIEEFGQEMGLLTVSFGHMTKTEEYVSMKEIYAGAENQMYMHKAYESSSMRSKTIDVIMNSLFEKSVRENAHSKRVSQFCRLIASKLDFDEDEIKTIEMAGLVHDIGKIGVDEKVLNKSGALDKEEWLEIRKHPEAGRRILSSVKEYMEISEFIATHHERWDGTGYPEGLKGEEIPIEARIIAVADAYDAMTSERTYKKPMSQEEAMLELLRCKGTHFDAIIVDVFVD